MKTKKATNKQIIDAYGHSYKLMQEAKRYDDEQIKKEARIKELEDCLKSLSDGIKYAGSANYVITKDDKNLIKQLLNKRTESTSE